MEKIIDAILGVEEFGGCFSSIGFYTGLKFALDHYITIVKARLGIKWIYQDGKAINGHGV